MNLSSMRGLRISLLPPSTSLGSLRILRQSSTTKQSLLSEILNLLVCHEGYLGRKLTIDMRPLVSIHCGTTVIGSPC